jgi:hypothetical protein
VDSALLLACLAAAPKPFWTDDVKMELECCLDAAKLEINRVVRVLPQRTHPQPPIHNRGILDTLCEFQSCYLCASVGN